MKLNRSAYEALVAEVIRWLMAQPRSLERDHILVILQVSADHEYGTTTTPTKEVNCCHPTFGNEPGSTGRNVWSPPGS